MDYITKKELLKDYTGAEAVEVDDIVIIRSGDVYEILSAVDFDEENYILEECENWINLEKEHPAYNYIDWEKLESDIMMDLEIYKIEPEE